MASADGTSHCSSSFYDPPSAQAAQQNFQPQSLFEVCWRILSLADLFLNVRGLAPTALTCWHSAPGVCSNVQRAKGDERLSCCLAGGAFHRESSFYAPTEKKQIYTKLITFGQFLCCPEFPKLYRNVFSINWMNTLRNINYCTIASMGIDKAILQRPHVWST